MLRDSLPKACRVGHTFSGVGWRLQGELTPEPTPILHAVWYSPKLGVPTGLSEILSILFLPDSLIESHLIRKDS